MLNIYFIDYYNEFNSHGLNTYTNQMISTISNYRDIRFHVVWIDSTCHEEVTHVSENNLTELYIPKKYSRDNEEFIVNVLLENFKEKKNLIVHLNWINHSKIAWNLKQNKDIKIILTKHCIPWRDFVNNDYPTFYALNAAYERGVKIPIHHSQLKQEILGYENIDHIITVTESAKYSLTRLFGLNQNKISVVYNGLDPKVFDNVGDNVIKSQLRNKYGFEETEKIIIYAGKISLSKGILEVVKIFDEVANEEPFKNVRLVIVGQGAHHQLLAKVKRFWSKITITGNLDKKTLYDFYQMADIGIVPSYAEQCSYSCIEMMYNALPVMVSDIDGLREIVAKDCGFKFAINVDKKGICIDRIDFLEKLKELLLNPKKAASLGKNARNAAILAFTSERMVKETTAIYQKIVQSHDDDKKSIKTELKNKIEGPLVSIIMPCYNSEKYLAKSIESIFGQTYENFELIIVNDGSTDSSESIIKENRDPRIVYIKNKVNKGITHSLNRAIKKSKGKYLIRMDADDIMKTKRLEVQVMFLEKNPDYAMVGSAYTVINEKGMPINTITQPTNRNELKLIMLFFNPFAHPTIAIRKEVIEHMNYDKKFLYCEDYELWFRVLNQHRATNLSSNLLEYRVHDKNTSSQSQSIMRQNVLNLLSRELNKIGVDHTSRELVLHGAISFGLGKKYFNTPDRIKELKSWLKKVFSTPELVNKYSTQQLIEVKSKIQTAACGH